MQKNRNTKAILYDWMEQYYISKKRIPLYGLLVAYLGGTI